MYFALESGNQVTVIGPYIYILVYFYINIVVVFDTNFVVREKTVHCW